MTRSQRRLNTRKVINKRVRLALCFRDVPIVNRYNKTRTYKCGNKHCSCCSSKQKHIKPRNKNILKEYIL